jgi:branched-chain amino acid transport system permease protein
VSFFVQQLVSGVATGGTYSLVALGFVLIFGVANILNVAQIEMVMLAPAFALLIDQYFGGSAVFVIPVALLGTVLAGQAIHMAGVRPFQLREKHGLLVEFLAPVVATFGLSQLIEYLMAEAIGSTPRPFPFSPTLNDFQILGVSGAPMDLLTLAVTVVIVLGLVLLIWHTNFGRSMRAVADSSTVAETAGISSVRVTLYATALASLLGGVAGILFAATANSVNPFIGLSFGLKGLVVMIVGGVRSVSGAVIAGLSLGVIESMVVGYTSSAYADVVGFGALLILLMVRPQGLIAAVAGGERP